MTGFRRYAKNTGWLFAGRVIHMLIGLVITAIVARYLGPEQFGLLNFVMAATFFLGVAANFGMDGIARRELVQHPGESGKILGTYFILSAGMAIAAYSVMAAVVVALVEEQVRVLLFLILGGVFVAAAFRIIDLWFNARVASGPVALASVLSVAVAGLFKLWLVVVGAGILWFASAILLESVFLVFLRLVYFRVGHGALGSWRFDPKTAVFYLRNGALLMLSALATNVYMKMDQVMIGLLIDDKAVGIYAAAVKLSTVWHFIPVVLATSLFPAIIKAKSQSQMKYLHRLRQYFCLNTGFAYIIMIPLASGGGLLIRWIYGDAFVEAGPILSLHIGALILAFLQIARNQYLLAEGFYRFTLVASVTGAVVNICLNMFLIPAYGGIGAAVSTIVAQLLGIVLINFVIQSKRRLGYLLLGAIFLPLSGLRRLSS